jgi:hypothetical protein
MRQWLKWLFFTAAILSAVAMGIYGAVVATAQAGPVAQATPARAQQPALTVYAGEDQTVNGPSPVDVWFDGCDASGPADIVNYQWFNQWGELRAEDVTCIVNIPVNFGKDPQPGQTREFTLVVTDAVGNQAQDSVVITLGEVPPPADPAHGSRFTGTVYTYINTESGKYRYQFIDAGFLNDQSEWYVSINPIDSPQANVQCFDGVKWEFEQKRGCVGDETGFSSDEWVGYIDLTPVYLGLGDSATVIGWDVMIGDHTSASIRLADKTSYVLDHSYLVIDQER